MPTASQLLGDQAAKLRCLACAGALELTFLSKRPGYPDLGPDGTLSCTGCSEQYPVIAGTPRMLSAEHRRRLHSAYPLAAEVLSELSDLPARRADSEAAVKQLTADSFAYEWEQFGALREEWAKNFADYMQPHSPESLADREVLDVGTGSGRHSFQAARSGARVVAVDLGASIDVARRNLPSSVLTVQADAEALPFAPESFDIVMSIGVLHHLPDPDRALRSITRYARPGGHVHVYLYWMPEQGWHRRVLSLVTALRRVTVRLPHRILHVLCYPLAAALLVAVVAPYRSLRRRPRGRGLAAALPLKTYADYPFSVLVNDQFDRFSAPLERRYTSDEVRDALSAAGLEDVVVLPNHGWVGDGRRPAPTSPPGAGRSPV
jgi:2-polyprenyl-3-methyl-5-hydroxy-6-metoxy-1,4-benzoquinol methylase